MVAYVKGFIVLFVILTLLLYLPPGKTYQKYIRFFTELILTIGLLTPMLSALFNGEEFLELIEYETFTENLSELSKDMEQIEYIHNDYYIEEYERAIEEDVSMIAEPIAEKYGLNVREAKVHMTEEYVIDQVELWITNQTEDEIVIDEINFSEESNREEMSTIYEGIAEEVADYYKIDSAAVLIQYASVE